jgi:hypothetical protein
MTTETIFDVLLSDGKPKGRLTIVGTAYPTPKGAGYRFTLKATISEGAQLVLLPSRSRGEASEQKAVHVEEYSSARGTVALVERR